MCETERGREVEGEGEGERTRERDDCLFYWLHIEHLFEWLSATIEI